MTRFSIWKRLGFMKPAFVALTLAAVPVFFVMLPSLAQAAGTYTVNRTDDIAPRGTGVTCIAAASTDCTVREAVIKANANPGSTILFAASLNGTPIVLTRPGNDANANTGDLDINASTTITGNGASNTIIQGAADASYTNSISDKIFGVNQDGIYDSLTVHFTGLTIRYGDNTVPSNDPSWAYTGGGVDVFQTGSGNVTSFTDCVISYNRNRNSYGGGLNFDQAGSGSLTLTRVTFDHNQTPTSSGGALNLYGENPTVSITDCTFTNNTTLSSSNGGALKYRPTSSGSLTIDNSLFSGNISGYGGAIYAESFPMTISNSRIVGNTATVSGSGVYVWTAAVTATNNWWGCSTGPSAAPCDTAVVDGSGSINYTPWFRDQLTAVTSPLATNQSTTLTAGFLTNSAGTSVPTGNLGRLINQSVTWGTTFGALSGTQATVQASGTATGNFQASGVGTAVIYAKVDNDNTSGTSSNVLSLTINKAITTTAITADTPDPSLVGQPVTVNYTVTGEYGNSPTAPTGNVTVSDGVNNCTGTVAAGSCNITLSTSGARTLTASYVGDGNFNGSTSAGESHTVNSPATLLTINFAGNGGNKVESTSPDQNINCLKGNPSGCSANYAPGTTVALKATPDWKSAFMGWSGDYISSDNPGTVTMTADKTVTATFDPVYKVRLMPNADFAGIQDAYDSVQSGTITIQAQTWSFLEDLILNKSTAITLIGGMNASYNPTTGYSTIKSLTVGKGSVVIGNITIK